MELKVTYQVVAQEGGEASEHTTTIYSDGPLTPEEVTDKVGEKHPEAYTITVRETTVLGEEPVAEKKKATKKKAVKKKAAKKKAAKKKDTEEGEEELTEDEIAEITEEEVAEDNTRLTMSFSFNETDYSVIIESMGDIMVDEGGSFEEEQDPIQVGAALIAAVQGVIDEVSCGYDDDDDEEYYEE